MPILNVKIAAPESPDLTRAVAAGLSELTARVLKKSPQVTAIAIDYVDPANWIIAGLPLTEHNKNSFYFDIKITDETNTKQEKEQYVREAFDLFSRLLGNVHEESYIYVQDVRAASYGYGGRTQEYRYHH
jgi:4-oxalocrotonate tautomerase